MKLHANAALCLKGRRELCRRVLEGERTLSEAAEAAEVSVRCARKWVGRYRAEGELGLLDRSSGRPGLTLIRESGVDRQRPLLRRAALGRVLPLNTGRSQPRQLGTIEHRQYRRPRDLSFVAALVRMLLRDLHGRLSVSSRSR